MVSWWTLDPAIHWGGDRVANWGNRPSNTLGRGVARVARYTGEGLASRILPGDPQQFPSNSPSDPSNNLGELLDCHFIGLIILCMSSSKCMVEHR